MHVGTAEMADFTIWAFLKLEINWTACFLLKLDIFERGRV
jgi:hypothetical protein